MGLLELQQQVSGYSDGNSRKGRCAAAGEEIRPGSEGHSASPHRDDGEGEEGEEGRNERLAGDIESHLGTGVGANVVKNAEYILFLQNMLENQFQYDLPEAGCDEAGRGCLAGPVFAAAVILPPDFHDPRLNDSKQMTARNRERLRELIEREAVAWAVEAVSAARIDEINILNASFEGMSLAAARLDPAPGFLAIDGNRFRTQLDIPYRCIVKGDATYADIAAASVLAKTHRDAYMEHLAAEFPQYGWASNKGYPTREHRLAIRRFGLTPHHRLTFNHEIDQLEFSF